MGFRRLTTYLVFCTALFHGGQVIAVVPEADLVIVANSRWRGLSRPAAEQSNEVMRFISDRLAPFLVPRGAA